MTSLGPLTYRRARYRSGASVDESLGLVDDYLTRPAQLGLLMMGHCTAREAAAFFAKIGGMTPSLAAPDTDHARALGDPRPRDAGHP